MIMDENHQFGSSRHHQAAEIGPKMINMSFPDFIVATGTVIDI